MFAVALFVSNSLSSALAGPLPQSDVPARYTFTQYHMGVDAKITVYAKSQGQAEKACSAAFERIAELDSIMSDYRKDSELNLLCAGSGGPAKRVSKDLFKVLEFSVKVSKATGGAFDVTCGRLVRLWRAARKSGQTPDGDAIGRARRVTGYDHLILNRRDRTVKITAQGSQLDLGGIAKGYAGDEAQKVLKSHGITAAMVEMGGDIVLSGPPTGAKGWLVRVPNATPDGAPTDMLFTHCGVSSSGDTEQSTVIGGVRYSHVVNPLTGWPLTNRTQATVVAPDGLTSDPLSTAMTILNQAGQRELSKLFPKTKSYVRTIQVP